MGGAEPWESLDKTNATPAAEGGGGG
jgi:hypothetical protein